ncbi:hypothetical protein ACEI36_05685 [Pseudomonas kielensis]|uniref:hypothetical protein n=1 Tax=Pseudomonas kielensis TaxID=2762577 RepID=UPI0038A29B8F
MHFFKRFFAFIASLFSSQETEHSEPLIPKIDPEKLKKKLDLQKIAREHGAKGIPRSGDTQLTAAEHAIRAELGRMREQTVKYGEQRVKQIQNRLDSIDITLDMNRAIELGNEFVRTSDHHLTREDGRMKDFAADTKTKFQILSDFRSENRLPSIPAKCPTGGSQFFKLMVVLGCCVLEGALNATFFGSGLEGGLLSGFTMAFMLSFFNVLACFLAGLGFRNKNHVRGTRQFWGWVSFALAVAVMIGLGVLISYFRYVLTVDEGGSQNAFPLVWQSLRTGIFPIQDFESLILFFGTIVFGCVGVWEGYNFTDRYPGYAGVWSQYAEAHRRYIELIEGLRDRLEVEKAEVLLKIDSGVQAAEKAIKAFKFNMNQKSIVKKQVSETLVMTDETLQSLTRYYQNENMMARPTDVQPPDYFDHPVTFGPLDMPDFSVQKDELRLDAQEQLLRELVAEVEPIRARVQSSFNQQYNQLQPLQDLV